MIKSPNANIIEQLQKEVEIRQRREVEENFFREHAVEYVALKEAELKVKKGLPHLYGYPWYRWALDFFESRNKLNFLCAANQISKSSTQIRKAIDWATRPDDWTSLWSTYKEGEPLTMLYFYPTANQSAIEFEAKWKQFLPRAEYKDHPQYGWKEEWKGKQEIFAIYFNSGATIYFKSYKQGPEALQTTTAYAVFLDEECPEDLWDELCFRVAATDGYIHMVFTATIGQELWRKTIEPRDADEEKFPLAFKRQVAMYDCQVYADGTPGPWTNERIAQVIATCKSHQEVQRRVYGRFVKDSGLKYPQFNVQKHVTPYHPVPSTWQTYVGADIGSGGAENHPAAIAVVACRPDYKEARVIYTWRGDGIVTTASDIYKKAEEVVTELNIQPIAKYFDWASIEFGEISNRLGGNWQRAEKSHELGEQVINVLFRNDMLKIYERHDSGKLVGELCSLTIEGNKRKKADDLCDALRYCVVKIPWDWSVIEGAVTPELQQAPKDDATPAQRALFERRNAFFNDKKAENDLQEEFNEWNASYEG